MTEQSIEPVKRFSKKNVIIASISFIALLSISAGFYFLFYRNQPNVIAAEAVSSLATQPVSFDFELDSKALADTDNPVFVERDWQLSGKATFDKQQDSLWLRELKLIDADVENAIDAEIYLEGQNRFLWTPNIQTAQVLVPSSEEETGEWVLFTEERDMFNYDPELRQLWEISFLTDLRPWIEELWLNGEVDGLEEAGSEITLSPSLNLAKDRLAASFTPLEAAVLTNKEYRLSSEDFSGHLTVDSEQRQVKSMVVQLAEKTVEYADPKSGFDVLVALDLQINLTNFNNTEDTKPNSLDRNYLPYSRFVERSYGIFGNVENQGVLWSPSPDYVNNVGLSAMDWQTIQERYQNSPNYTDVFQPAINSGEVGLLFAPTLDGSEISPEYSNFYYCTLEQAKDKNDFFEASLIHLES